MWTVKGKRIFTPQYMTSARDFSHPDFRFGLRVTSIAGPHRDAQLSKR
jgi:hypothetical protein